MKRLTLNKTWELCLKMWKWIAAEKKKGNPKDIEDLKTEWVEANDYGDKLENNCFFCEYIVSHFADCHMTPSGYCKNCPGTRIEKQFYCCGEDNKYHYGECPLKFYKKLLELNRKRKKQGEK